MHIFARVKSYLAAKKLDGFKKISNKKKFLILEKYFKSRLFNDPLTFFTENNESVKISD